MKPFNILTHPWPGPDTITDPATGKRYPVLYRIYRRPAGMWGCWVVFRWGGKEHVPDLSCPIDADPMPRDAKRVPDDEAIRYWSTP
jgi:hypothetical protein